MAVHRGYVSALYSMGSEAVTRALVETKIIALGDSRADKITGEYTDMLNPSGRHSSQ